MTLISTHNVTLPNRLAESLKARGFTPRQRTLASEMTVEDFAGCFLNSLFSFPYLDFAFVRYEADMQIIDLEETFHVFGCCDAGLFAVNDSRAVFLIDEEENVERIADDPAQFTERFHLLVHASTSQRNVPQDAIDTLGAVGIAFWDMVAYAVSEGDALPRRHVLAALKDGAIESL